jgi:hypothetical protein
MYVNSLYALATWFSSGFWLLIHSARVLSCPHHKSRIYSTEFCLFQATSGCIDWVILFQEKYGFKSVMNCWIWVITNEQMPCVGISKYCVAIELGLCNYIKAWGFVDSDWVKLGFHFIFLTFEQNFQVLFEWELAFIFVVGNFVATLKSSQKIVFHKVLSYLD